MHDAEQSIRTRYQAVLPVLDEQAQRFAAAEALALGCDAGPAVANLPNPSYGFAVSWRWRPILGMDLLCLGLQLSLTAPLKWKWLCCQEINRRKFVMEKQFLKIHPAKLAGWFFQAGNFGLLALGSFSGGWSNLAAGVFGIAAGEMMRRRGDDTRWFAGSSVTSVVAITLTNYNALSTVNPSELLTLSSPATATAFGTALFAIGYGFFGAFSSPLSQSFKDAKNRAIRWTLGRPRLTTGILGTASMVPMIKDTIASQNIPLAAIITSLLVGQALIAASSPDKRLLTKSTATWHRAVDI